MLLSSVVPLAALFLLLGQMGAQAQAAPEQPAVAVAINELRIDQASSSDDDEYFELKGSPATTLDGLTYVVIGDGAGLHGVVEVAIDLDGQAIPADGYFLTSESASVYASQAEMTATLNFENSDNVTHLLVRNFTGANDQDLDPDDDGVLEITPWDEILDLIALVEEPNPPTLTEYHYGPPSIGPEHGLVPAHAYACPTGWQTGGFDLVEDSPGAINPCQTAVPDLTVSLRGPAYGFIGGSLVYSITLENQGPESAYDVLLIDNLPDGAIYESDDIGAAANPSPNVYRWALGSIAAGVSTTYHLTVTVNSGLTATTTLINHVEVSTSSAGENPDNNQAESSTPVFPRVSIRDIQAATHYSPLQGQVITDVHGIVTAVDGSGFYVQDPDPDGEVATSEGIYVVTDGSPTVDAGDEVLVDGTVSEFYANGASSGELSLTRLTASAVDVLSGGNPLPLPIVMGWDGRAPPSMVIDDDANGDVNNSGSFDPDDDGVDFFESLEGMLVQLNGARVVGSTHLGQTTVVADDGASAALLSPRGALVVRENDFNPERLILDDGLWANSARATVGDRFTGIITGVVSYSGGHFRILNRAPLPPLLAGELLSETTTLEGTEDELTVATLNANGLDVGDDDFNALAQQIVAYLRNPDILSLSQVQDDSGAGDDGTVSAERTWSRLISAIAAAGGPLYDFRDIAPVDGLDGGAPGDNSRVGFLFRPNRVTFVDRAGGDATTAVAVIASAQGAVLSLSPGRVDPGNAAFDNSHKSLAAEFLFNGHRLFLIANHFNSRSGDAPLFGRLQPPPQPSRVQRLQQAQVVHDFVSALLAADSEANVIVLGQFNDFQFSPVLDTLRGNILYNLMDTLPAAERYTHIAEGNARALDHILLSAPVYQQAQPAVDVVHLNAEFDPDTRPTAHDPVLVQLTLPPATGNQAYVPLLLHNAQSP